MTYIKAGDSKKIVLKSDSRYWVEIVSDLTWKQMRNVDGLTEDATNGAKVDAMLLACIKSWNLDDDKGVLPIIPENIDQLKRGDIEAIVKALGAELKEDKDSKKNSSRQSRKR